MKTWAFWLCLCCTMGCSLLEKSKTGAYISSDFENYNVQKVLVLPLQKNNQKENLGITSLLNESLQRVQRFEVISISNHDAKNLTWPSDRLISAALLVKLAKTYRVQAILRGYITAYNLTPMSLGLKLELISTADASILWAAEGIFYDEQFFSMEYKSPAYSMTSLAPKEFIRNSCYRLTSTLGNDVKSHIAKIHHFVEPSGYPPVKQPNFP